ncbi:MAG: phage tail family protein [Lachnospiraceae bacterium]|nr:phage tail family protein [Lachnospiraceae bacterium]
MNEKTVFIYESRIGRLEFRYNSRLWITDVGGISSVEVDISESRSSMQTGSSITAQSVKPRFFTIDGAIFEPIGGLRERLLDIIAPQVPATLTVEQNGESWFLDVVPEKTPEVTPGNGVQFFQLRLHAAYPYWRTTSSYAMQLSGLIALFRFPFCTGGKWWLSKYSDSYFSTVVNNGNTPMDFKLIFIARSEIENPELYHVDTRKRILIRKVMTAGERIIISTVYGQKGAVLISASGEVTNGFRYLSIDSDLSMALLPGPNLLRCDAGYNREGLRVRIEAPKGVKSGV